MTALVLICLLPAIEAPDVNVTHTATLETRTDNGDDESFNDHYRIWINRFNLGIDSGDFTGLLRVDTTTFGDRPIPPRGQPYVDDLRLERIQLQYNHDDFRLVGGDFYRQLGRGIVLSLRKESETGIDVAIRGGEIKYSGDNHEVSIFGGVVNPVNFDTVSQKHVRDTEDVLVGGQYEFRGIDGITLGAYALYSQPKTKLAPPEQDFYQSFGLYFEMNDLLDWLTLYAEADGQYRRPLAGAEQAGYAGYLSADFAIGDTSVLVEGIFLDFEQRGSPNSVLESRFFYNRPPTLQRIREEVLDNQDVIAGRVRVEHYFESIDLVLFVNALGRVPGHLRKKIQIHGWGGGEYTFDTGTRLSLTGGYRHEFALMDNDDGSVGLATAKTLIHLLGNLDFPINDDWTLKAGTDTELRSLRDLEYVRGSSFLGLERAGYGSLTLEFGYDTEKPNWRNFFFAAILGIEATEHFQANLVAGTQRGGLKCINGDCREYPLFAGMRLELIGRF